MGLVQNQACEARAERPPHGEAVAPAHDGVAHGEVPVLKRGYKGRVQVGQRLLSERFAVQRGICGDLIRSALLSQSNGYTLLLTS